MAKRTAARSTRAFAALPLEAELHTLRTEISASGLLTPQSERRICELLGHFATFVHRAHGIHRFADVDKGIARTFIEARLPQGIAPSPGTMHLRRCALRLLFRAGRKLETCDHDPTLDISLPARSPLGARPLTDEEIALCRSHSIETLLETRQPAAWALAETSATTTEISHIHLTDLEIESERVWLHGGRTTTPRWGYLSAWGLEHLERRARARNRRAKKDALLVYEGNGSVESRTASCCIAISNTLRRAGLATEPHVRPSSVRAWAGLQVYRDTESIEEVARRLGVKSLDRAARLIGHGWNAGEGP